ncbi:hypothetical protein H0H87_006731 [Tephrocybe sp. NHM501043]|nr:hypothetical protein H0H87_006731 [Tephrocybe sp. NHM501043]
MLDQPHVQGFAENNGYVIRGVNGKRSSIAFRLGLRLQQAPLSDSYFEPDVPKMALKPTNTYTKPSQPHQHRPKDRVSLNGHSRPPSMTKGKAPRQPSERSRAVSSINTDVILRQLLEQETEAKASRRLLRIALEKVETLQERAMAAENARKVETEREARIARTVFGVQEQVGKARQDAEVYRLQLERVQREVKHQQELMRTIEVERDLAEKAAVKAREVARQLNDERMVALARQEGRQTGFVEGVKQGRKLAIANREREAPLSAFIEELWTPRPQTQRQPQLTTPPSEVTRREKEASEAARREKEAAEAVIREKEAAEVAKREKEAAEAAKRELEALQAARQQFDAAETARRELEVAKRQAEEQVRKEAEERERQRQAEALEEERRREAIRTAEREIEQQRAAAELKRLEQLQAEAAVRTLELENIRQRELEKERELEIERQRERRLEEERNKERRQREESEAALAIEREKVQVLEREREVASLSSSSQRSQNRKPKGPLEYMAMPQPPPFSNGRSGSSTPAAATNSPLPLHVPPPGFRPPQQLQPRVQRRRTSQSSQETSHSGSTSINAFDIVTFPGNVTGRTHLSDIPEVASDIGRSPSQSAGQSPVEATTLRNIFGRQGMENVQRWVDSTAASEAEVESNAPTEPVTTPTPTRTTFGRHNSPYGESSARGSHSNSTIQIEVQPPSRTESIRSGPPLDPHGRDDNLDHNYLTPQSRPLQLAPDPPAQPQYHPQQRRPQHHPQQRFDQNYQSPYQRAEPELEHAPVIPNIPSDILDGSDGDGIQHLTNFGSPMIVSMSMSRGTNSEAGSSSEEAIERRERGRQERAAERAAGRPVIYPPPPALSSGARTATSLYAQPRNPAQPQTPRTQFYSALASSAGSAGGSRQSQPSQTPRQPPMQIYSPSQTPRQIYSNMPSSSNSGSNIRPNLYAPPGPISASTSAPAGLGTRTPIYASGTSVSAPVIPPPPSRSSIYASSPSSGSVIPNPPGSQSFTPGSIQRQIYNNNPTGPVIPSSSANGYPYPVGSATPGGQPIGLPPGATPGSSPMPLPGNAGLGMRTPGGSYLPSLPTMDIGSQMRGGATPASRNAVLPGDIGGGGWGVATPASQTRELSGRGSATPRVRPTELEDDDDDDAEEHDLTTRYNTVVNGTGRIPIRALPSGF